MTHKKHTPSIIVTMGPSLYNEKTLKDVLSMNVSWVRFNMSHGTHDEHRKYHSLLKKVTSELKKEVKSFADLQGPKIRIGKLIKEPLTLLEDTLVTLTSDNLVGTSERLPVDYPKINTLTKVGGTIFLHDGMIALIVLGIDESGVLCKVTQGGEIKSHQGVNIPDALIPLDSITEKDKVDLAFALKDLHVDGIALSFVKTKNDLTHLKELIKTHHPSPKTVISKIETKLALHHIKEIVDQSDIIMLARGDLGIEIKATKIPLTQKEVCLIAKKSGKPVIVATQILTSMITSEVPTRAELTDAIDGLIDGATCLMLSDETTIGDHPSKAVQVLDECISEFVTNREKYVLFENNP